ncbi:hypothetical protein Ddye_015394 [Dipteronia dyeriana]|uniref:O-fucosyltransferase family protein n=1 Tax=Dipteronia dyeriana TaxID=168575 RepID=A0AAD9U5L5_9ROSI|nr:hypothetical protein Ddye_015394 [Dipteronia dyeriana]
MVSVARYLNLMVIVPELDNSSFWSDNRYEKDMLEFIGCIEGCLKAYLLKAFENHSNQMATLDFIVVVESGIFLATYGGNIAKVVEGHRSKFDRSLQNWDDFSLLVKESHEDQMGKHITRLEIPDNFKYEDYFYFNPHECLPPSTIS